MSCEGRRFAYRWAGDRLTSKTRLRILIVDDDDGDRLAIKRAMSEAHDPIKMQEATSLESGFEALRSEVFDCVLLDWHLPDQSGVEFLHRVNEIAPDVPVIVLTGHDPDEEVARRALRAGAEDNLEKSALNARAIMRSIRYAIERKRAGVLKAQLLHSDRLGTIGQLAAGVAHEVNNPATWVVGNLSLLQERLRKLGTNEAVSELLPLINDCQRGMERIVDTVRDLKRYAQPSPPRNDLLDLNAVVREAHRIARPETRHRAQIVLVLRELPPIRGDAGTLGQLVINLLINAAHALDSCPSPAHVIRVTTEAEDGEVLLAVEDTGPGVPLALQERIFEPFFTTRTHSDGSGMGLAICRDIARRHGGNLSVGESDLGGARFEVRIQSEETPWDDMETRTIRRSPSTTTGEHLRVLVVDDEPQILEVVTRLLSGCEVVTAGNGLEALEQLRLDSSFDGVLCDLMMPDMDGAELVKTLNRELPYLSERVVLCTGGAVTPQLGTFLAGAPCMVLHKPFSRGELAQVVDHWRDLRTPVKKPEAG